MPCRPLHEVVAVHVEQAEVGPCGLLEIEQSASGEHVAAVALVTHLQLLGQSGGSHAHLLLSGEDDVEGLIARGEGVHLLLRGGDGGLHALNLHDESLVARVEVDGGLHGADGFVQQRVVAVDEGVERVVVVADNAIDGCLLADEGTIENFLEIVAGGTSHHGAHGVVVGVERVAHGGDGVAGGGEFALEVAGGIGLHLLVEACDIDGDALHEGGHLCGEVLYLR